MKSLFVRFFSGFIIIVFLLIASIFFISVKTVRESYIESFKNNLSLTAKSSIFAIEHCSSADELKSKVKELATASDTTITLYSTDGKVITTSSDDLESMAKGADKKEVRAALNGKEGYALRNSLTVQKETIYIALPVKENDKIKYVIRVQYRLKELENLIEGIKKNIVRTGFISIIISMFIAFFFFRKILDPISEITKAAQQISDGDFSVKVKSKNNSEEIEKLVSTFNLMTEKINLLFIEISMQQKIKKDFVANVSHELKTPLTAIKGFSEMMIEDETLSKRYLDIIRRNTDRLINIVNDLLMLSSLEDENASLYIEEINLADMLENTHMVLRHKLEKSGLSLIKEFESHSIVIEGDRYRLEQLTINLLDNAIKYTEKGSITIKLKKTENNRVELAIKDTGIGIPEKDIPRIFERFYVVDKSRSRKSGGTGLGLSIIKHIVALHKGTISIKSKEGDGTEFKVTLPVINKSGLKT